MQEYKYLRSDLELKYYDIGNRVTSVSASTWKNSVNTPIGDLGMHLSSCALRSLNSMDKITRELIVLY